MSTAYSGSDGTVTFNSVDMCVTRWSADYAADELDATSTCDSGWKYPITGLKSINGTFDCSYDPSKTFLEPGDSAAVVLNLPSTDSITGTVLITAVAITSEVAGIVTLSHTFRSQGSMTVPS